MNPVDTCARIVADPYADWETRNPGRMAFGYLCTYVPEEILHAAGFTPIRIVPTPIPAARSEAHLQSYTCGLARSCLDQALTGKLDFLRGVVFAHTCDTMQGLADIWRNAFPHLFVDTVISPVTLACPHAKSYLVAELRRLIENVERHFGIRIGNDALGASIRLHNEHRRLLANVYTRRDAFGPVEFYHLVNAGLLMPKEGHVKLLQAAIENSTTHPTAGDRPSTVRLALVGSTLDGTALVEIIESLGARVVADDFCNGARYFDMLVSEDGNPIEAIAQRSLSRTVCPCKHRSLDERQRHLLSLIRASRADAVIFYLKKFCDPHAWDYVPLAEALKREQVPHLLLETDQAAPVGPTRVRVEAFLELVASDLNERKAL